MRREVGLAIVLGLLSVIDAVAANPRPLPLSSLSRGCAIETRWVGIWPRMPEAAVLKCGTVEFLIRTPSNLYGHVSISSPAEALEFVRLFTSAETYLFVDLDGMVELFPGDVSDDSGFNVVERKIFAKRLKVATARQTRTDPVEFEVKRTVVLLDQKVYQTTEIVTASGLYTLLSKRKLLDQAQKVGVMHFGDL